MITEEDYKVINEELEKFIYFDEPLYEEDLVFDHRFCDILYENNYTNPSYFKSSGLGKKKSRIGLEKTKEIAINFFDSINPKYRKKLEDALDNGIVEFEKAKLGEKSYFENFPYPKCKVYFDNTIADVFNLVHEFMHYLNTNDQEVTVVTQFYTESFSTFIELMVCDYILENYSKYAKDSLKMRRELFESLYQNNLKLKLMLGFIDVKLTGKEINSYTLKEILEQFDYDKIPVDLIKDLFDEFICELMEDIEEAHSKYVGYTVGMILGCKMYDLARNEKHKNEIFDISDNLYMLYANGVLNALGLECEEELKLGENSYKELEKIYISQLKKLW